MAFTKYTSENIKNPYENKKAMDNKRCEELYDEFMKIFKKEYN